MIIPKNKTTEPKPTAEPEKKIEPSPTPTKGEAVKAGDVLPPAETQSTEPPDKEPRGKYLAYLCLGALGIVYGDIGTSPLYSLRECFHSKHGVSPTPENVMGVLSLVTWSLIIVISIKYLVFVMRADNKGEGGILALMSLVRPEKDEVTKRWLLTGIGLFGAALLYGDGIITPAISVLSAVEGLHIATPVFEGKVVHITIVVLFLLFYFQKKGTGSVGAVFGPVMLVWFFTLFLLGVHQISQTPSILKGVNPYYAFEFFLHNKWHGFLVLGSVFLVVTGGEALYADMGHFGKKPIRLAWFFMVLPALQINYLGQGALLLRNPSAAEHPFYLMAPSWATFPLVGLATFATFIASQAVISGAFSLTTTSGAARILAAYAHPSYIGKRDRANLYSSN